MDVLVLLGSAVSCIAVGSRIAHAEDEEARGREGAASTSVAYVQTSTALLLPVGASLLLLLLFFYLEQVTLLLAVLVCGCAALALYFVLSHLWMEWGCCSAPSATHPWTSSVAATTISLSTLTLWWLWGHPWPLNNVLAMSLAVFQLHRVRIPSLQVAAVLMTGLFVYDIFWVFHSANVFGKNVMVKVAQSVDMPIKLVAPNSQGYSMLGLGDIFVPGLVIVYMYRADMMRLTQTACTIEAPPWSFVWLQQRVFGHPFPHKGSLYRTSLLGYLAGLLMAFWAVRTFQVAQPALLYLVPSTLIPIVIHSHASHMLRAVWTGSCIKNAQTTPQDLDLPV